MNIYFHIHYITTPGQILVVCGNTPETGNLDTDKAPEMVHLGQGNWHLKLDLNNCSLLEYQYHVRENGTIVRSEWGEYHQASLPAETEACSFYDFWQQEPDASFLYSSAFSDSLLAVPDANQTLTYKSGHVIIKVFSPIVRKNQRLGISGDTNIFGNWEAGKALPMIPGRYPEWQVSINAEDLPSFCHYKFVLTDSLSGNIIAWEWGEPRILFTPEYMDKRIQVCSGMSFRFQEAPWKGTGVAIPVFSLRSEDSWGCGDFGDLKKMIEWTVSTGQQLIQLLPLNDTTLTGTWQDSYPYNAVSIFALHPLYLSPALLPAIHDKKALERFETERQRLNEIPKVDYEGVMKLKWSYFKELFKQESKTVFKSDGYVDFFKKNSNWLVPYAAFCYLRNHLKKKDFNAWGEYAVYQAKKIETLCNPGQLWHEEVSIHYFIQYLLHLQLTEARNEAHDKGAVLKGDIPIGVNRFGVDVWTEPHLFNLDAQIGAPPDVFSITGQNWGFPAYNWELMASEDFRWWKRRFSKMADYFDVYRIDHMLGFFRIWEIPSHSVQGLLGHFNPALPYHIQELVDAGFVFKEEMAEPYITREVINLIFGELPQATLKKYLKKSGKNQYNLLPTCNTQKKIQRLFPDATSLENQLIRDGLYQLCHEVLFVRDSNEPGLLHPRINAQTTWWYKSLPDDQKNCFDRLYEHFFYYRNVSFWKEKAYEKLPPLLKATRMLVCGEDLGMIPSCVPEVMQQLQILSLEIQRMPKTYGLRFENLNAIPYMSVCTTSTHDMNPLRAWWKEDKETATQFYQQVLWKPGVTPRECTPEIAREIIQQHLASPAMWVIIPWQDWLATDALLRRKNPNEERINIPSDPSHRWNYRMHLTIEELITSTVLNNNILEMIQRSGRKLPE